MFSIIKFLAKASAGKTRRGSGSGEQAAAGPESRDFYPSRAHASTSGTVTHRDLCIVVLRDTLRLYGIPREWISAEVLNLSGNAAHVRLQINLVIHYWHEGLLMFAPALQKEFLQTLQRFDMGTDHSRHSVCWKFSSRCHSPFTDIPSPSFWATPLEPLEDNPSGPITLSPALEPAPEQEPRQPVREANSHPLTMDSFDSANSPFRFDLPSYGQQVDHLGDFPTTIPLGIERTG
jgi:hypothetical protein